MKLLFKSKDGGAESLVTGYWLIEWKRFFSIVLLRFDRGSREAYHTHAFNCFSWVLTGMLEEHEIGFTPRWHLPSLRPFVTLRGCFHRVFGQADRTWVLSFRGPWVDRWHEYRMQESRIVTLTHGRKEVA